MEWGKEDLIYALEKDKGKIHQLKKKKERKKRQKEEKAPNKPLVSLWLQMAKGDCVRSKIFLIFSPIVQQDYLKMLYNL